MSQNKRQTISKLTESLMKGKVTTFSNDELVSLINEFRQISDDKYRLDRHQFRDFLNYSFGMTDDVLMDRVFRTFDVDCDNFVTCDEWVRGLSVYLNGTLEDRAKFTFNVYDLNGDGYITREEMYQLLKGCLTKTTTEDDQDESTKDLVELLIKKIDTDHDGRLNYSDYLQAITDETLLLECLGSCFPKARDRAAFLFRLNCRCDYEEHNEQEHQNRHKKPQPKQRPHQHKNH